MPRRRRLVLHRIGANADVKCRNAGGSPFDAIPGQRPGIGGHSLTHLDEAVGVALGVGAPRHGDAHEREFQRCAEAIDPP
jgi:hypothetical protein